MDRRLATASGVALTTVAWHVTPTESRCDLAVDAPGTSQDTPSAGSVLDDTGSMRAASYSFWAGFGAYHFTISYSSPDAGEARHSWTVYLRPAPTVEVV